jgi:hypothetical protein
MLTNLSEEPAASGFRVEPKRRGLVGSFVFGVNALKADFLLRYKSPVFTSQETLHLRYKAQPVNAV